MKPDWYYDDRRHLGLDFDDPGQVARYDQRQRQDAAEARRLLADLGLRPGQRFADIGCGTGLLAVEAAVLGAEVTAVDISAEMLEQTRTRAAAAGVDLETLQASFLDLPLQPRSFDLITSCFALHHLPDFWKAEALVRLKVFLKPEGRLFLRDVTFSCPPTEIAAAVEGWIAWMEENTGYRRAETTAHLREEHSTFDWIIEGLLQRAGYRIVETVRHDQVYCDFLAAPALS